MILICFAKVLFNARSGTNCIEENMIHEKLLNLSIYVKSFVNLSSWQYIYIKLVYIGHQIKWKIRAVFMVKELLQASLVW